MLANTDRLKLIWPYFEGYLISCGDNQNDISDIKREIWKSIKAGGNAGEYWVWRMESIYQESQFAPGIEDRIRANPPDIFI